MAKQYAQCDRCGLTWNVSASMNISKMYIRPKCAAKMEGKKYEMQEVWSEDF